MKITNSLKDLAVCILRSKKNCISNVEKTYMSRTLTRERSRLPKLSVNRSAKFVETSPELGLF